MNERERVTGLPLNGQALQALRIDRREGTQKEVARKLGVSEKTIQNWENDGRPRSKVDVRLDNVAKVAAFYKVPPEQIIAEGYMPAEPLRTAEEALGAIQQQLLDLSGVVGKVALGVDLLVQRAERPPASKRSRSKRSGRAGPQAG